jgi:hypothetical protein
MATNAVQIIGEPTTSVITYSRDRTMLICSLCPGAVAWRSVHHHLFRQHGLLQTARQIALGDFQPDPTVVNVEMDWPYIYRAGLPNGSPVEPQLPIMDGFQCKYCNYITQSRRLVQRHLTQQHRQHRDPFQPDQPLCRNYTVVRIQCWRPAGNGKPRQYWTVDEIRPRKSQDTASDPVSHSNSPHKILPQPQRPEVPPDDTTALTEVPQTQQEIYYQPNTLPESGAWYHRTRWPEQFHGRSLAVFLWAANPLIDPGIDWVHPSTSFPLLSSAADEEKITLIVKAAEQVL